IMTHSDLIGSVCRRLSAAAPGGRRRGAAREVVLSRHERGDAVERGRHAADGEGPSARGSRRRRRRHGASMPWPSRVRQVVALPPHGARVPGAAAGGSSAPPALRNKKERLRRFVLALAEEERALGNNEEQVRRFVFAAGNKEEPFLHEERALPNFV